MVKINTILLILFSFFFILHATEYPGVTFLSIFPGARSVGMAGAFSSITDDALATYYNPAGLAFQTSIDNSFNYSKWRPGLWSGMYYIYDGLSLPITNDLILGTSFNYLNSGETEVTDFSGTPLGEYSTYEYAIGLSIGKRIRTSLGVGATIKYIYSHLIPDWVWQAIPELGELGGIGSSVALDIGLLYSNQSRRTNIGVALINIGPNISYTSSEESDRLPLALKFGVSHKLNANTLFPDNQSEFWLTKWFLEQAHICFAFDIHQDLVGLGRPWYSFGIEFAPLAFFSFRCGYFEDISGQRGGFLVNKYGREEHIGLFDYLFTRNHSEYNKIGLSYGFGLDLKFLRINFAMNESFYGFSSGVQIEAAINIGTPILSDKGIIGLFAGSE